MSRFLRNLILLVALGFSLVCESLSAQQTTALATPASVVITSDTYRQLDQSYVVSRLRILNMQGGGVGCDETEFKQILSRHVNNLAYERNVRFSQIRTFSFGITDQGTHDVQGVIIAAGGKRDSTLGEFRRDFGVTTGQAIGLRTVPGGYYLMEPRTRRGVEYVFVLDPRDSVLTTETYQLPPSLESAITTLESRALAAGKKLDSLNPFIRIAHDSTALLLQRVNILQMNIAALQEQIDTTSTDGTVLSVAASFYGWPDHWNDLGDAFLTFAAVTDVGWLDLGGALHLRNWGSDRQLKIEVRTSRPVWRPLIPLLGEIEVSGNSALNFTVPLLDQFNLGLGGSGGLSVARSLFWKLWAFVEAGGELTSIYEGQHSELDFGPYARSGTQIRLGRRAATLPIKQKPIPGYNIPED